MITKIKGSPSANFYIRPTLNGLKPTWVRMGFEYLKWRRWRSRKRYTLIDSIKEPLDCFLEVQFSTAYRLIDHTYSKKNVKNLDFYQTHSTINYKKISASKWTKLIYVLLTGTLNISLQSGAFNLKSTSIEWNPSFETPLSGGNVKSLVTNYNPEKSRISRRRK